MSVAPPSSLMGAIHGVTESQANRHPFDSWKHIKVEDEGGKLKKQYADLQNKQGIVIWDYKRWGRHRRNQGEAAFEGIEYFTDRARIQAIQENARYAPNPKKKSNERGEDDRMWMRVFADKDWNPLLKKSTAKEGDRIAIWADMDDKATAAAMGRLQKAALNASGADVFPKELKKQLHRIKGSISESSSSQDISDAANAIESSSGSSGAAGSSNDNNGNGDGAPKGRAGRAAEGAEFVADPGAFDAPLPGAPGARSGSSTSGRSSGEERRAAAKGLKLGKKPKALYGILGVAEDATIAQIKAAYKALALKHHPDKGGNAKLFQSIQHAHEVLTNPRRKAAYDETGEDPGVSGTSGSASRNGASGASSGASNNNGNGATPKVSPPPAPARFVPKAAPTAPTAPKAAKPVTVSNASSENGSSSNNVNNSSPQRGNQSSSGASSSGDGQQSSGEERRRRAKGLRLGKSKPRRNSDTRRGGNRNQGKNTTRKDRDT